MPSLSYQKPTHDANDMQAPSCNPERKRREKTPVQSAAARCLPTDPWSIPNEASQQAESSVSRQASKQCSQNQTTIHSEPRPSKNKIAEAMPCHTMPTVKQE
ncbi:hypothetical protein BC567DRAFT_68647 [Phyllosticta citribraziliensis]